MTSHFSAQEKCSVVPSLNMGEKILLGLREMLGDKLLLKLPLTLGETPHEMEQ